VSVLTAGLHCPVFVLICVLVGWLAFHDADPGSDLDEEGDAVGSDDERGEEDGRPPTRRSGT
jgi:hypothetical protein